MVNASKHSSKLINPQQSVGYVHKSLSVHDNNHTILKKIMMYAVSVESSTLFETFTW